MIYLLLFINEAEAGLLYVGLGIVFLIVWFALVRWSVRSNDVVRNQEIIIHIMIQQFKKQGATVEEIKELKKYMGQ